MRKNLTYLFSVGRKPLFATNIPPSGTQLANEGQKVRIGLELRLVRGFVRGFVRAEHYGFCGIQ
jgi:hypothetical protein